MFQPLIRLTVVFLVCQSAHLSGQGFREIEYSAFPGSTSFGLGAGPQNATPTFIDIDGDQDLDLFIGDENGMISFYQNIGSPTRPDYTNPIIGPFGIGDNFNHSSPVFADIDDDGDYDLLVGTQGSLSLTFFFYLNTGTRYEPQFVRSDDLTPFDLDNITFYMKPTFGDMDNDGDFDLLVGHQTGFWYAENIGSRTLPLFAEAVDDPFGLPTFDKDVEMSPQLFDFDNDGDLDIISGRAPGNVTVYFNFGEPATPLFNENSSRLLLRSYKGRSAPALGDIDNDGDIDMLVAYLSGARSLQWHMGTDADPVYHLDPDKTPLDIGDVGNNAKPELFDFDYDGDLDILIGSQDGDLFYQENVGSLQSPLYGDVHTNPFGLINPGSDASPAFVRRGNASSTNLYVGTSTGEFWEFENIGSLYSPSYILKGINTDNLTDIGDHSSPTVASLDGTSDFDFYAGSLTGGLTYFSNLGDDSDPSFDVPTDNPLGISSVGLLSTPEFIDIDHDIDLDLVVGDGVGRLNYFENNGTTFSPSFGAKQTNPFGFETEGVLSHPATGDIDNDGDIDLLVGNGLGQTRFYENKPCKDSYILNRISDQQQLYQSKDVIYANVRVAPVNNVTFIGTQGLEMVPGFEVVEGAIFQGDVGACINN